MKELNMKKVIERYNGIMYSLCYEHNTIGTSLSEDTENWNLRDMVSECQYCLDCCYEDGHANNEGQYPEYWDFTGQDLLNKSRYERVVRHNKYEEEAHRAWVSRTRRLRNFIKAYSPYIKDMKCYMGHCSFYDNELIETP